MGQLILTTGKNLIRIYFIKNKDWDNVINTAIELLKFYNTSWESIVFPDSKNSLSNLMIQIFYMLVYSCFIRERYDDAVTYLDIGSSRYLAETISFSGDIPEEIMEPERGRINTLIQEIKFYRSRLQDTEDNRRLYRTRLREVISMLDPYRPKEFNVIKQFLPEISNKSVALLYITVTKYGGYFAIVHDTRIMEEDVIHISEFNTDFLYKFYWDKKTGWFTIYNKDIIAPKGFLRDNLPNKIKEFEAIGFTKVINRIKELNIKRLVVIPQGWLHTFAFDSLSGLNSSDMEICYVPNAKILYDSYNKVFSPSDQRIFTGFSNPCEDSLLAFTDAEIAYIRSLLPNTGNSNIYWGREGTVEKVKAEACHSYIIHLSTHGNLNSSKIEDSSLSFFDKSHLTLKDIVKDMHLSSCFMVCMSACSTGIPDINSFGEFIGLSAGFMTAGAKIVISTLWPVADISTALLMGRFYENIIKNKNTVVQAMSRAKHWLKMAGYPELIAKLIIYHNELDKQKGLMFNSGRDLYEQIKRIDESLRKIDATIEEYRFNFNLNPSHTPYDEPYYWAGFVVNGWGFDKII